MEKGVASEHYPVIAVFHVPADAVLSMAGSVESLDRDVSDLEALAIGWSFCDRLCVLSCDDWQTGLVQVASLDWLSQTAALSAVSRYRPTSSSLPPA